VQPRKKGDFVTFSIKIPRASLNLNTLQEDIQSKFDGHKDLRQFKVRVSQKEVIASGTDEDFPDMIEPSAVVDDLDVEWQPSCLDLADNMESHRADGNCLCYALYEAYGKQETLVPAEGETEAISVRNLRRHIVTAQVNELRQLCANVPQTIGKSLETRRQSVQKAIGNILNRDIQTVSEVYGERFDRVTLFLGLNGSGANIQNAVNYIKEQRILSRNDISNIHLSNILTSLGMPEDSQFITEYLNQGIGNFVELKLLSVEESPTNEDLLITLCDGLIRIGKENCFENQQELDCDRLLNAVQRLLNSDLGIGDVDILKLICNNYNDKQQNNHIILENNLPAFAVQQLIKLAQETVKTNGPNSDIHNDCLPYVVQMLQRPILLIYENCELQNGRMSYGNERGKVGNCALYTLDGQLHEYSVNEEGRLMPDEKTGNPPQFSEVSTNNMITIAMHPGHYYGILSFEEQKLHIGNNSIRGANQEGLICQPPFQARMFHSQNMDSDELHYESPETIAQPIEISTESRQEITNLWNTLEYLIQGTEICNDLNEKLTHFAQFISYLQRAGKSWQIEAEIKNLQHIQSCAEEMLDKNGLNFKPEFVTKIVLMRLSLAMFGSGQLNGVDVGTISMGGLPENNTYAPSSMWDFGERRTVIPLQNDDFGVAEYEDDGVLGSPRRQERGKGPKKKVNLFSVLRGDSNKKGYYTMEGGQATPSSQTRFQQYLRFISREFSPDLVPDDVINRFLSDPNNGTDEINLEPLVKILEKFSSFISDDWQGLKEDTPLGKLPPALMISIGIQFGQIRQGTWNPFAVAAKKYFALQSGDGKFDRFTWKSEVPEEKQDPEDIASCAFGSLLQYIWPERSSEYQKTIKQFEEGLCAYYAMTQEVLSRTDFPGNKREDCNIGSIFRLEDVEAIEAMGVVTKKDEDAYSIGSPSLSTAKRPVFASTSAVSHLASLDHPNAFPPPIKIITKYSNVHHARIFGCHLFNVDSSSAARPLGNLLPKTYESSRTGVGTYRSGCPFFNDYQRECLTMLNGLNLEVVGVLAAAIDRGETYVLTGNNWKELLTAKYIEINVSAFKADEQSDEMRSKNWEKIKGQINFCLEDDLSGVGNIVSKYSRGAKQNDPNLKNLHDITRSVVSGLQFTQILKLKGKKKKTNSTSKRRK
jgi:hypothetical protein